MINVPSLLVGGLILAATLAYIFRAWERTTALVAGLAAGGLALLFRQIDAAVRAPDASWQFGPLDLAASPERFGFTFRLHEDMLPIMALACALAALGLLLAARVPQGRSYAPVTLMLLAGYAAFFMLVEGPLSPVLIQPLILILLSCLSAVGLQAGRAERAGGPLRWLVAPVLAFPLFLIANWYLEQAPLDPQDYAPLGAAAAFLAGGALLMMAPVPLHSVQPASAETSPPLATAVYMLLYQLALIFLLSQIFANFRFMQQAAQLSLWFSWAGLMTALWAGVAAIGAPNPGRLWGYASLHNWGLMIMLISAPTTTTWSLVAFLFLLRAVSMMTSAVGLTSMEQQLGSLHAQRLPGAGVRMPWAAAAYLLGGLGLVGFPLGAGFAGYWAALLLLAETDWRSAAAVLLAASVAIIAFIRMGRLLFGPLADPYIPREGAPAAALAALMVVLSIGLAVAPQLLDGMVGRALLAFGL